MSSRSATTSAGGRTTRRISTPATLPIAARRHPLVREVDRQLAAADRTIDGLSYGDEALGRRARSKSMPVLVGVSGGADSVALLLACVALRGLKRRDSAPFEPIVLHVHHHLRPDADADAAWVERLCQRLGVACHLRHVYPAKADGNVYANARRMRLMEMLDLSEQTQAKRALLAHHAEDQLETMLMFLCRGAGPHALAGMRASRCYAGMSIVRPLLRMSKKDCEEMCRAARVKWREDPSNKDRSRSRARLRQDVLPVLEELWPGAAQRASQSSKLLADAADALQEVVDEAFGSNWSDPWPRSELKRLPDAVLTEGLLRAAIGKDKSLIDSLTGSTLLQAAEAIRSDDRKPRSFRWSKDLTLVINAREVWLDTRRV
jgi:tRNA(Ile)-lysidine synthase